MDYLTTITALYDKAVAEGYAISEDGQAALDETVTTLNNAWVGQYNTRNEMIRSNYGPYMTYDHLLELLERRPWYPTMPAPTKPPTPIPRPIMSPTTRRTRTLWTPLPPASWRSVPASTPRTRTATPLR